MRRHPQKRQSARMQDASDASKVGVEKIGPENELPFLVLFLVRVMMVMI
ncbi:MAG: hypothetical protein HPY71_04390 [Firmicutes bacterium]|nr:hypothetical protein [Bacillota bacterium]